MSNNLEDQYLEAVAAAVASKVSAEMNNALLRIFREDEVSITLSQLYPTKAPGLDVLAKRLKLILPHIISETQGAFVPGHLIKDNVLVAFDINHYFKGKTWGKTGHASLKLDMSKAYDRVKWILLEKMMKALGSAERWVELVMKCVKSVSYSVVFNAEQLDDSLFFFHAMRDEAMAIREILHIYEKASVQQVNIDKSALVLSKNTSPETAQMLSDILRIQAKGTTRQISWIAYNHRKVKEVNLRQHKGEILAEAARLEGEISISSRDIWNCQPQTFGGGKRKVHRTRWGLMCKRKERGGMGFHNLEAFNLAILGKQAWLIFQYQDSLLHKVCKSRYIPVPRFQYQDSLPNSGVRII
ncbi:hypothetical protein Acr_21g0002610 [Actinidia rufa]|uniref:Reverse transcriptase n=1 Tax=Actinidia rufa TaxID=165716 RepID=A0A7J0GG14_9ERIC|nr:hypothetical protein Acr_21g0002610 [Actinidia rufa]